MNEILELFKDKDGKPMMDAETANALAARLKGAVDTAVAQRVSEQIDSERDKVREEIELEVREEYAEKYDISKSSIVNSLDDMTDSIMRDEMKGIHEAEVELVNEKNNYKKAAKAHTKAYKEFVTEALSKEIRRIRRNEEILRARYAETGLMMENQLRQEMIALHADQKNMNEKFKHFIELSTRKLAEHVLDDKADAERRSLAIEKMKGEMRKQIDEYDRKYKDKVNIMNENNQEDLAKMKELLEGRFKVEMQEVHDELNTLQEEKIKFIREKDEKWEELKNKFIVNAAKSANDITESTLRTELDNLKASIREAQENNFGRKLFQTFATEFQSSGLAESTNTRQLADELEDAKASASKARSLAQRVLEEKKDAERQLERSKILNELLGPLPADERQIMGTILERIETSRLRTVYENNLDRIMRGSTNVPANPRIQRNSVRRVPDPMLTEEVTAGDKKPAVRTDAYEYDPEVEEVLSIARRVNKRRN